jgi:adenosine deaminase
MPKTELHVHLDGSIRPGTLLHLAADQGIALPRPDADALRSFMKVDDARSLEDYLRRFEVTLSVLQTADALEQVAYELVVDAAEENVRYIEVRFSPILCTRGGLHLDEAVEAPLRGLRRAEQERGGGVRTNIIICAIRSLSPTVSMELAELAVAFRDRGVVGFDLAGPERGNPARNHQEAFRLAAAEGLATTVHAGEDDGPDSIRDALVYCNARRIGHGTHLPADDRLLCYVRDFRVPLEVCLTSNVQTHAVPRFEDHPLRQCFDRGLVVTLSTDNRLMSDTTVTEEYWRAHRLLALDWPALREIALMGFRSAFLPAPERDRLEASASEEMDHLATPNPASGA